MDSKAPRLEPEFESVEAFVGYLLDDERTRFSLAEAARIARRTGCPNRAVIEELKSYGLEYVEPTPARRVRGFTTSSNDRWWGPGSSPAHGGSGYEQIAGFAGRRG